MPTLYDNFERVRQYIDQHQADVDFSAYVSYAYLESKNYIDDNVNVLHGPLFVDYSTPQNNSYTLSSYSHIVAGTEDKTGVSFVATKRKCGGADGTTYMAAFFTNSDGRSKFAHKTKVSNTGVGAQADDAFMCFNAYGFKIAYSGTEGVSASTEYEILHEGNIGNLGYVTQAALSANSYLTQHQSLNAYVLAPTAVGADPTEPYRMYTTGLGANNNTKQFYPTALTYNAAVGANNNAWASVGTVRNYVEGRIAEIEASYVTSSDLPVIDENIIPKETTTYTLGDPDHLYANTYTRRINSTNDGINIFLNNSNRFAFQTTAFKANVNNVNLGTSSNKWAATYTYNLYADTIHNFIWTGTSAEYAALDNYTTYQIYLIQEA